MDLKSFISLIHTGEIDQWMRKHNTIIHQCPPEKLLKGRECSCFYCVDCTKYAMSKVKETKTYYQVGKEKFTKEELDENK